MDNRSEIREFLTSRRGRITPQQAGLPVLHGHRRVPGLRREEVAMLAGVSIDYYNRLERGNLSGVSESVLEALAGGLQLDEAERTHLFDLARIANTSAARAGGPAARQQVRPSVARILETMSGAPAFVRNNRSDVLAANALGRALYCELYRDPTRPVNTARFFFLNPRATEFYAEWEQTATDLVSTLRAESGRSPHDKALTDLIGELSTHSEAFRVRWATHDVRLHRTGSKLFRHPVVGELRLTYEMMDLPADPGLAIVTYNAEAGSPSQDALDVLASWAATLEQDAAEAHADRS